MRRLMTVFTNPRVEWTLLALWLVLSLVSWWTTG